MGTKVEDDTWRSRQQREDADPLLGQVVEQYRIESLLGTGAMGMVYRGVHEVIGKAAAIKVLKADVAADPVMVERLVREARAVNAIRHPSIVDIYGFGKLPQTGQPYIIMDLLEGEPLDKYLEVRAPVSPRLVQPLLDELLSALSAAHAVGVIHRDLKPGNVFVEKKPDGKRSLKVIDFGLAKSQDRSSSNPTNPGTLMGTPAFMAPEQALGGEVGPYTDLYAVGGIAYQVLTNHLPHEATTAIEVITQKLNKAPLPPRHWVPALPEAVDAWVMALLERDPARRPSDAEEVRQSLKKALDLRPSGTSGKHRSVGAQPRTEPVAAVPPKRGWKDASTDVHEAGPQSDRAPARSDPHTQLADPAEVLRSHGARTEPLEAPPPPRPAVAAPTTPSSAPAPVAAPTEEPLPELPTSHTPLYVALGTTVLALLLGLAFLLWGR